MTMNVVKVKRKKKKRHCRVYSKRLRDTLNKQRTNYINIFKDAISNNHKSIWCPKLNVKYNDIPSHSWFNISKHTNNRIKKFSINPDFFKIDDSKIKLYYFVTIY